MNNCPVCSFVACPNSKGQVRSDHLRRHVLARHKTPVLDYIEADGTTTESVTPTVIIKKNRFGAYTRGFCFCCGSYLSLVGTTPEAKLKNCKFHVCKQRQARGGATKPSEEAKPSRSILKTILNHPKFAGSRVKLEEDYGDLLDNPEADEIEDFVIPWMADLYVDAVEAEPIRNALAETISNLEKEKNKLEDFIEQLKTSSSAKEKDLTERMYALSKQVSEESSLRHAAEARLKGTPVAAPAPAPDKITLVDERTPVQWSLLYQG
jgi:hypothetical protein